MDLPEPDTSHASSRRGFFSQGIAGLGAAGFGAAGLSAGLSAAGLAGAGFAANALAADGPAKETAGKEPPSKVYRIGVISATIGGKPQRTNGHTYHFCHPFHPQIDLDAIKKHLDPGSARIFAAYFRNPRTNFDQIPFADTKVTHYFDADPSAAAMFCECYPGCKAVKSVAEMLPEVDAIWLGDASGRGDDHFDLIAPALEKGLPTFCDKPIGETVAGTRKILEFARKHKAPLMSSSLFRHQWGTEQALRLRDTNEFGRMEFVLASMMGGYSPEGWFIYGQHPAWMVMTLCGPGVESVSLYSRENTAHGLVTWKDRQPAEIWYGRPDCREYSHTSVHFANKVYDYTPAIEHDYWLGHSYQMFRMAYVFRDMIRTGKEPVPHQEILEVTAMIHAGAKSLKEKGRLVDLAEVMA